MLIVRAVESFRAEQAYGVFEDVRATAQVRVWCRLPNCHVMGPNFCAETASLETFVSI
jgi:hypothetical protein